MRSKSYLLSILAYIFLFIYVMNYRGQVMVFVWSDSFPVLTIPEKHFSIKHVIQGLPKDHVVSINPVISSLPLNGDELVIDKDHPNYTFYRSVAKFEESEAFDVIKNLNGSWIHLKNMYVSTVCSFSPDGVSITIPSDYTPTNYVFNDANNKSSYCKKFVKHLIAIGHCYHRHYGHWFCDTLAPLELIPEEIKNKSMILMQDDAFHMNETLLAEGFNEKQFLIVKDLKEWVFAENLYCVGYPISYLMYFGPAMRNLSIKLRKAFGVYNSNATDFALANRSPKSRRHITNFQNFTDAVKKEFPKYHWIEIGDMFKTVKEAALIFSKIKFLFTSTGSNMIPTLFMPPGGVVVDLQDSYNDHAMEALSICSGQKLIAFFIPDVDHFKTNSFEMNITKSIQIMKYAIYQYENKKWPDRIKYNY